MRDEQTDPIKQLQQQVASLMNNIPGLKASALTLVFEPSQEDQLPTAVFWQSGTGEFKTQTILQLLQQQADSSMQLLNVMLNKFSEYDSYARQLADDIKQRLDTIDKLDRQADEVENDGK